MITREAVHSALIKSPPDSAVIQPLSLALYNLCRGVELRPSLNEQVKLILELVDFQTKGADDDKQA